MTALGALVLLLGGVSVAVWLLNLIRRGRLYVGYGIVLLALIVIVLFVAVTPGVRNWTRALVAGLFPHEPVAVIGLAALLLLFIYLLHQLSVLSDRVATLTQELAMRSAEREAKAQDGGTPAEAPDGPGSPDGGSRR